MHLRVKKHHETGPWLFLLDYSDAFDTVNREDVLKEVSIRDPEIAPFVAECHN